MKIGRWVESWKRIWGRRDILSNCIQLYFGTGLWIPFSARFRFTFHLDRAHFSRYAHNSIRFSHVKRLSIVFVLCTFEKSFDSFKCSRIFSMKVVYLLWEFNAERIERQRSNGKWKTTPSVVSYQSKIETISQDDSPSSSPPVLFHFLPYRPTLFDIQAMARNSNGETESWDDKTLLLDEATQLGCRKKSHDFASFVSAFGYFLFGRHSYPPIACLLEDLCDIRKHSKMCHQKIAQGKIWLVFHFHYSHDPSESYSIFVCMVALVAITSVFFPLTGCVPFFRILQSN